MKGRPPIDIKERLLRKTEKTPTCWIWKGSVLENGYGQISTQKNGRLKCHRCSWMVHNGPIPENIFVLHKCDNRRCVNPEHLFLGTQQDNANDMVSKKRQAHGIKSPHSKFSPKDVDDILNLKNNGAKTSFIKEKYGVNHSTIWRIITKRTYKYI